MFPPLLRVPDDVVFDLLCGVPLSMSFVSVVFDFIMIVELILQAFEQVATDKIAAMYSQQSGHSGIYVPKSFFPDAMA